MLNDTDGDSVNSIADTPESLQMSEIVEDEYRELLSKRPWRHEQGLFPLESLGDSNRPNYLKIPVAVEQLGEIKYNKRKATDTKDKFLNVIYCEPVFFIDMLDSRDSSASNIKVVTDFDNSLLNIRDDFAPTYWTSFDDVHIIFDSYDKGIDSTVQGAKSKSLAFKNIRVAFSKSDTFVPDLPEDQFPLLLAICKKRASQVARQVEDTGATESTVKLNRVSSRQSWRARGGIKQPNYGRGGRTSTAGVKRHNPQFDKT